MFVGCVVSGFTISFLLVSCFLMSLVRPDFALSVSYGDFSASTSAAKKSATDADKAATQAKEALARIAQAEKVIQGQRATIDAAFTLASDANRIAGVATQTLAKAEMTLKRMQEEEEFFDLMTKAIAGYADAYDTLKNMPESDPRFPKAFNMRTFIEDHYALWNTFFTKNGYLSERFGKDSNVTISQIENWFPQMDYFEQSGVIPFVRDRSSFPIKEKLNFMYWQTKTNANLRLRASAGESYMRLAGLINVNNPLAFYVIDQHWKTNSVSTNTVQNPKP